MHKDSIRELTNKYCKEIRKEERMEERKAYIVTLDRDPELTYVMGLTRDQVSVFKWLRENGYDIDINEQGDVIIL